jgi:hypothetical protein
MCITTLARLIIFDHSDEACIMPDKKLCSYGPDRSGYSPFEKIVPEIRKNDLKKVSKYIQVFFSLVIMIL